MAVTEVSAPVSDPAPMPAELLIPEAREHGRRRWRTTRVAVATLAVAGVVVSFAVAGGPPWGSSSGGAPSSLAIAERLTTEAGVNTCNARLGGSNSRALVAIPTTIAVLAKTDWLRTGSWPGYSTYPRQLPVTICFMELRNPYFAPVSPVTCTSSTGPLAHCQINTHPPAWPGRDLLVIPTSASYAAHRRSNTLPEEFGGVDLKMPDLPSNLR